MLLSISLALAACGGGGGGSGGGGDSAPTVDVNFQIQFPVAGQNAIVPMVTKDPSAVQSVGVVVTETSGGAVVLAETEIFFNAASGLWEGTLTGLPTGISLNFEANAYDGLGLTGNVIYTDLVTQTLSGAGPNTITFNMVAVDLGPGLIPVVDSVAMAASIQTGSTGNTIQINILYSSLVDYTVTVALGSLNGIGASITGTHDPVSGPLTVLYDAPATIGTETITIELIDSVAPGGTFTVVYPITLSEVASAPLVVNFGPAITALSFSRTATTLAVNPTVSGTGPFSYSWSGSASFSGLTGAASSVTINPFDDAMAGNVTVTVTDANGLTASVSHPIVPGAFPYNLVALPSGSVLEGSWSVCWFDGGADVLEILTFTGNSIASDSTVFTSTDGSCTGTPTPQAPWSGTFVIGADVPTATLGVATVTATELDVTDGISNMFSIFYIDTVANPNLLYLGDELADSLLDGTSPANRPMALQEFKPRVKQAAPQGLAFTESDGVPEMTAVPSLIPSPFGPGDTVQVSVPVDNDVGYIVACVFAHFIDANDISQGIDRGCTNQWSRTPATGTATQTLQLDGVLPASSEYWVLTMLCTTGAECDAFTGNIYTSVAGASTYSREQWTLAVQTTSVDTGVAIPTYTSPGGSLGFVWTNGDGVAEMTGAYTLSVPTVNLTDTTMTVNVPVDSDAGSVCVQVGQGYNLGGGFTSGTVGSGCASFTTGSPQVVPVDVFLSGHTLGTYSVAVSVGLDPPGPDNTNTSWIYASTKNPGMFRAAKYPGSPVAVESEIGVTIPTFDVVP